LENAAALRVAADFSDDLAIDIDELDDTDDLEGEETY
jgi:hypothetical protein